MDMKLGTVVGIGHTRFAAHVARPSGGQRSSRGQIRSNRVNVGVWAWNLVGGVHSRCQQF